MTRTSTAKSLHPGGASVVQHRLVPELSDIRSVHSTSEYGTSPSSSWASGYVSINDGTTKRRRLDNDYGMIVMRRNIVLYYLFLVTEYIQPARKIANRLENITCSRLGNIASGLGNRASRLGNIACGLGNNQ